MWVKREIHFALDIREDSVNEEFALFGYAFTLKAGSPVGDSDVIVCYRLNFVPQKYTLESSPQYLWVWLYLEIEYL